MLGQKKYFAVFILIQCILIATEPSVFAPDQNPVVRTQYSFIHDPIYLKIQ